MSQAVPSFSSFPDLDNSEEKNRAGEKGERKSRKDRHRKEDEKPSRRRHSGSRSRSREGSSKKRKRGFKKDDISSRQGLLQDERIHSSKRRERSPSHERAETLLSRGYFVDKKGDERNITYGSLHQGDVPKFYRAGRGTVLGLSSVWNIQRSSGIKQIEIGRRDRRKVARYTDSKSLALLMEGPRRLLAIPTSPDPASGEFIALSKGKKMHDEDVHESYRSIERGTSNDDNSDASSHRSFSSSSDAGVHTLTAEQHTIKTLEMALASSPNDTISWLRLLDSSVRSLPVSTKRATRARAEISVSLLRRAIDAHSDNATSLRLRLLYLEHGSEIWSEETLREEWERTLNSLGASHCPSWKRVVVWLNWIDWRLIANRTMTTALNDAKRVFAQFHGEEFARVRVRLCWRVAVFLREAGFLEQGMALLQAQVELSHFCPESLLSQPFRSKLDALETFWEAEAPCIGEEDAKGWATWDNSRPIAIESGRKQSPDIMDIQDPYQHWFHLEKALDFDGVFPTKSFNEDQQDPYSTVLFSDIRPFLSDVQGPDAKEYLRLAFLSFLGLNIPGIAAVSVLDGIGEHQSFLHSAWMYSGLGGWVSAPQLLFPPVENDRLIMWETHIGTTIGLERPRQSAFGPVKDWVYTRSLFEGVSVSGERRAWEAADIQNLHINSIRRSFEQLKDVVKLSHWDDLHTAFEAALDVKSAIKTSKQRLETDRSSLHLWRNHARLERIRDKNAEAAKIYKLVMSLNPQSSEMPLLVADAVEFFWLNDDQTEARQTLSRFLDIQGAFTGLDLLRARKNLEGRATLNGSYSPQWEACTRIKFFLELCATNFQEAIAIIDSCIAELDKQLPSRESLTVWLCTTIFSIAQIAGSMVPPVVISGRINAALAEYSGNTILLGLFLECERGLGIWGRVRNLLDDSSLGSATVVPKALMRVAWEVWAEAWGYGPWEHERVRMKLERVLSIKSLSSSLVLWQIYLAFEMRVDNFEGAKAVLFRALGCCPWAKDLYMMAFGPLRAVFKNNELNDLVAVMAERGLRMRRDLEEFLEGWEEPYGGVDDVDHDNEGDAELEALMHNRERAKPY